MERYREAKRLESALSRIFLLLPLHPITNFMDLFELTRALIDIESISGKEKQVGLFLFDCLSKLAARHQGRVERMEVEPNRFNLFAHWGEPIVTLRSEEHTSELQSPCNLVC